MSEITKRGALRAHLVRQMVNENPTRYTACPRCFGRGYQPEARKPTRRNPNGNGFYARTCPRCSGRGYET